MALKDIRNSFFELQSDLNDVNKFPVLGVLSSPIKALVSVAMAVYSVFTAVIFGTAATLATLSCKFRYASELAGETAVAALVFAYSISHLVYACSNIATLGILGLVVERLR